jgi:glycosyltransferase involved in cell wall biosynthesis
MNRINNSSKFIPGISIGLPVYNGEKYIKKRIESILNQSFQDFEIIVSNNASTDLTEKICIELEKRDERIKYFKQSQNIGGMSNFSFVLSKANREYFVWASHDDEWDIEFLKKNYKFLEVEKSFVGCVAKVDLINLENNETELENESKIRKILRNKIRSKRPNLYPINGKYYKKIRSILKSKSSTMMYGLMRTKFLQKSMVEQRFLGDEWAVMFNIVKYGNYNEIDEKMLFRREQGVSWNGLINFAKNLNHNKLGVIFPNYPLTLWCFKNFEKKIFLTNLDQLIIFNLEVELAIILEVILAIKNKIIRKKLRCEKNI